MEIAKKMISAQLSLFDTAAAEIGSFYKPGDLVKIRKVPAIAKHVKCGHTYKIHEVEPSNGLLKFWNPFASQWDYLHPEEVKLALAPTDKIDSLTPVEVAVSESTVPTCGTDTETGIDAVIESNSPLEIDSVTDPISIYKPGGTARSGEYYRLSYRDGDRVRHQHIRGGNTDSPIAQAKVREVRSLLAAGVSPAEISATLRSHNSRNF
ncbi:hypothetical protein QUA10_05680 [Microcoleus sp. Pol8_D6]|uniref:hypothetical protein n=1 Tax=unclassified Microcoleus TaxID=2642155 RepID=UPI002FD5FAAE